MRRASPSTHDVGHAPAATSIALRRLIAARAARRELVARRDLRGAELELAVGARRRPARRTSASRPVVVSPASASTSQTWRRSTWPLTRRPRVTVTFDAVDVLARRARRRHRARQVTRRCVAIERVVARRQASITNAPLASDVALDVLAVRRTRVISTSATGAPCSSTTVPRIDRRAADEDLDIGDLLGDAETDERRRSRVRASARARRARTRRAAGRRSGTDRRRRWSRGGVALSPSSIAGASRCASTIAHRRPARCVRSSRTTPSITPPGTSWKSAVAPAAPTST